MSDAGTITYATQQRTIPAGVESAFDVTAAYVACIAASHTQFEVRFNDGPASTYAPGIHVGGGGVPKTQKVSILNKHATDDLTVEIAYGIGQFSDQRLALPDDAVKVQPTAANPPFNMQQDAGAAAFRVEQTGFLTTEGGNITPLQGNKWAGSIPATMSQTVVAAAANLNGIIVHFLKVAGAAGTTTYALEAAGGGNLWHYTTSVANEQAELRDVFIPPGDPLKIYCLNSAYAAVVYEVL